MSKIDLKWETRFQELVEYKRIHGNCNVSTLDKANPHLGRWVITQRTKEETMSEERRKRLNSIGFTWKVRTYLLIGKSVSRHLWITNEFTEIAMYHVSKKTNPHLGIWVMTQRTTKETMSEDRRKQTQFDWICLALESRTIQTTTTS